MGGGSDSGSGSISCGNELPAETVAALESAGVKTKADQNMERYKYAETQTGVPWQVLAALHYREAGMDPNKSISNGAPLGSGVNADGVNVQSDANEDAKAMAEQFVRNAGYFSDVTSIKVGVSSLSDIGKAFATYKGGEIYQCNKKTFLDTTYVMNGWSAEYMNMTWKDYDVIRYDNPNYSYCTYKEYTPSWIGKSDNIGALTVFAYLGGCSQVSNTSL